jgi:hypothetical protein
MTETARAAGATNQPELPALPTAAAELATLRTRLRAQRRALWLRRLFGRDGQQPLRCVGINPELDAALRGLDSPKAEQDFAASDPESQALSRALVEVEAALASDPDSPLARVARLFGLDTAERDLVEICLAAAVDPSLLRAFAFLDHSGRPLVSAELTARLYGWNGSPGARRALSPESPLRRWELIREEPLSPGEPSALSLEPQIREHLLGGRGLDVHLLPVAALHPPLPPLPRWPVADLAARIEAVLQDGGRIRVRMQGISGSGRRTLAAVVCAKVGLPVLGIDSDRIEDERWPQVFLRAQRQAYLDGTALAFRGEAALRRHWPEAVPVFPVQFVIAEHGQMPVPLEHAIDHPAFVPAPSLGERAAMIRAQVPAAAGWEPTELEALAARHRLTVGEIAQLGRHRISVPSEASALLRESTRHRLGELARWVDCPFTPDDLVLPRPLRRGLEELVFEAKERPSFWERPAARRLFPEGRGLCALFVGPAGTGKTMAAQVVAAQLGLDLFRISLASVISKYIGDTSKNIKAVLARAEEMDAVLLFDEADALFGKRTEIKDAHDRFANTDTNYLLQAIEAYQGVALLASNKKANIDPAFLRRIRAVLEFPRPEAAERRELWQRLVRELDGKERADALAPGLESLAASIDATGAQIKYAVLAGIFSARRLEEPLGVAHLVAGLERELVKEGRSLSDRERERLQRP